MKQYYNYFYKITNNINNKFYFGVHRTDNINDNYMGSGVAINKAYEKYGKENFTKEIIMYFDTLEEAYEYESEIVNDDLVKNRMCYNLKPGGYGWCNDNKIYVYNECGEIIMISKDDEKFIDGTYKSIMCDARIRAKSEDGDIQLLNKNDKRILSGEYVPISKLRLPVKDKDGKIFCVYKTDERYLSGEVVPLFTGKKHSEETKNRIREALTSRHFQQGEKNSQYGTCWITNGIESLKIKKDDVTKYLNDGWKLGRVIRNTKNLKIANKNKAWIHKNGEIKFIYLEKLDEYLCDGWKRGKTDSSPKYNPKPKRAHYNPFNGKVLVEINGVRQFVDKSDERLKTGELQAYSKGKIAVKDKDGNKFYVSTNDPRYLSGELTVQNTALKGKIVVKNNEGKFLVVDKNDERYLSGELTFVTKGMKYKHKQNKMPL